MDVKLSHSLSSVETQREKPMRSEDMKMKEKVAVGQMASVQDRVCHQVPWMCVCLCICVLVCALCICMCVLFWGQRSREGCPGDSTEADWSPKIRGYRLSKHTGPANSQAGKRTGPAN